MSFDNFQLTPFLLQELYKDYLIELDNGQLNANSLQSGEIPYKGKNARKILILTMGNDQPGYSEQDMGFLIGILKACGLGLPDIALVEITNDIPTNYVALTAQFAPEKIISFGNNPADIGLPIQFPHYQLQSFNNQVYVIAPPLSALAADVEEKKKLWNSLKKLFNI